MATLKIEGLKEKGGLPRGAKIMIFEAFGGDWNNPHFREVDTIARVAGSVVYREFDPGRYVVRISKPLGGRQHITYKYEALIGLLADGSGESYFESGKEPVGDPIFDQQRQNYQMFQNLAPRFSRSMVTSDGMVYRCEWGGGMCDGMSTSRTGAILHEYAHLGVSPFGINPETQAEVDRKRAEIAAQAAATRKANPGLQTDEAPSIEVKGTGGKHIVRMDGAPAAALRPPAPNEV